MASIEDAMSTNAIPIALVDMIDYFKELVAYLKRTGAIASLKHTVNQECEVRWNSKVTMLESIQKQYQDIRELLKSRDQEHRLDGIHQDQLTHFIDFLTLFKFAINELEGEHYPTIHMVLLQFFKLKKQLALTSVKSRIDLTEWEKDTTGLIVDEVQEYSSTNFHIDGSAVENRLSFWKKQGQSFPRVTTTAPCKENCMHSSNKCCEQALLQCSRARYRSQALSPEP